MERDKGPSLPQREANLFKQVLIHYENRQYKKGLKTAEMILKRHPEHGETLAIKGLILGSLDRKEEAYELVKKGLKKDLKSHVSWHAFGLLYRSDKNYEEAIKCYRNALRNDKENSQILRDLSLLQIQSRNYEGFTETRRQILTLFPKQKASWIGLAIANLVQGSHDTALEVLEAYEKSINRNDPSGYDQEHSEFLLFKNLIMIEKGDYELALKNLGEIEPHVYDELTILETRADLLLKLQRFEEASKVAYELLSRNPENRSHYDLYFRTLQIQDDSSKKLAELAELEKKFPRAHVPKRLALAFAEGAEFESRIGSYLNHWLQKGTPSLFNNLKSLVGDSAKLAQIEKAALSILEANREAGKKDDSGEPTTYLWALYLLAQLYDFKGDIAKALDFINQAVSHTPTVVEVVQERARIFKHGGDLEMAAQCINQARELDLQDRFINTKCTKYMIRNNMPAKAEATINLFIKNDGSEANTLVDLQCMWFALENGYNHLRQETYGKALKRFHQVDQHFVDFIDDQFDFHLYCLRKMTLKAYLSMLRYEDEIRNHKFFFKGALGAIQCYLEMYDSPQKLRGKDKASEFDDLPEEERKKALNKLRKAEAKAKANAKPSNKNKDKNKKDKKVDPDPNGEKLLKNDPLQTATQFLGHLEMFHPKKIETHLLGAEVYLRKGKMLLAARSLRRALALAPEEPRIHPLIIRFLKAAPQATHANQVVSDLVKEEIDFFSKGADVDKLCKDFADKQKGSLPGLTCAAKALPQDQAAALFGSFDPKGATGVTLKNAVEAHTLLASFSDKKAADTFKDKVKGFFPLSTYFHGKDVNAHHMKAFFPQAEDASATSDF